MSAGQLSIAFLNALTVAGTLFLVGSGLTLVFGALRIVNIAHGSFYMCAALLVGTLVGDGALGSYWVALPIVVIATGALGALVEVAVLRRLYGKEHLTQLLATFALFYIFDDLSTSIWGRSVQTLSPPAGLGGSVSIVGEAFPIYNFFVIVVATGAALLMWLLLQRTLTGWRIRAALADRDLLAATGTNVGRLFLLVFVLGAGLAALGGAVAAPMQSVGPGLDATILVDAFVVSIIGGMGSIGGAALAAILLGLTQSFGVLYAPTLVPISTFAVMIVVLVVRPEGLLGASEH